MTGELWSDEICELVDAAFETVSRNPSDYETVVAYRRAIAAALAQGMPARPKTAKPVEPRSGGSPVPNGDAPDTLHPTEWR